MFWLLSSFRFLYLRVFRFFSFKVVALVVGLRSFCYFVFGFLGGSVVVLGDYSFC